MIEGLKISRADETTVPYKLTVSYAEEERDDQTGSQVAGPIVSKSKTHRELELPWKMTATEAKQKADILLRNALAERTSVSFTLPLSYLHLEVGDCVTLVGRDGGSYLIRLTSTTIAGLSIDCTGVFTPDSFVSTVTGESGQQPPSEIVTKGSTEIVVLDIPAVRAIDSGIPTLYVAASGTKDNWNGASLLYEENGVTTAAGTTDNTAYVGYASNTLGGWKNCGVVDFTNKLTVKMKIGSLSSVPLSDLLQNKTLNLIAVGQGSGGEGVNQYSCYELIQFATATLVAPNTYELSGLLRGRFGTEHFTEPLIVNGVVQYTPHRTDDVVVVIDSSLNPLVVSALAKSTLIRSDRTNSVEILKGASVSVHAITFATSYRTTTPSHTVEACVTPRSVAQVYAVTSPTTVLFKWQRRTVNAYSFFNQIEPNTHIKVQIRRVVGSTYQNPVREVFLEEGETSWEYTKDMQTEDGITEVAEADVFAYRDGFYSKAVTIQFNRS